LRLLRSAHVQGRGAIMTAMRTSAFSLLALAVLPAPPAFAQADVAGTRWRVESIAGAPLHDAGATEFAILPDGRMAGSAGCNRFTGAGAFAEGVVRIGPLAATRMACSPALMEQERRLFDALAQAVRYEARAGVLALSDSAGAELMRLRRL
jgi:putative lipoprotein